MLTFPAARTYALFVSPADPSDTGAGDAATRAIQKSVRTHGTRGCALMAATEVGAHPETAGPRLAWARRVVTATYDVPRPARRPARVADRSA